MTRRAVLVGTILSMSGNVFAAPASFKDVRDRGVHYFRKGLHEAAVAQLDRARAMPEGKDDFRTHFTLAKATYELLLLERTLPLAERAVELATSDRSKDKAKGLLKELSDFCGGVTLKKAPEARTDQGYVYLEDTGGLINTRKKEVFGKLRERYRTQPTALPATIYLPFGQYTANRVPFKTQAGELAEILIIPDAEAADSGVGGLSWIVGGTAAAVAAGAVAVVLLSAEDEPSKTLRLAGGGGL